MDANLSRREMEDFEMSNHKQGREDPKEVIGAGTNPAWMQRHLSDSIYLWACGEKADESDDEPNMSDRLLGWLILFMQGFAYTMLIVLARATSDSDANSPSDGSEQSRYLLPSVTGAMYLLIASTAHDLCAGISLLMNGLCAGHRAFGIGLLIVHGFMICAAMTVLVSTSSDSTSVVLNAVTVLFVADLDEKALKLFLTVPQKWRLFWAIESIGISFALALVAIVSIGGASPLLQENNHVLQTFPTWFVWGINPAAVTLSAVLFTSTVETVGDFWSETWGRVDKSTSRSFVGNICEGLSATIRRANGCLREEPCFYVILGMWVIHGVASVCVFTGSHDFPLAFKFVQNASAGHEYSLALTKSKLGFIYINALLTIGLALKTLDVFLPVHQGVSGTAEAPVSSDQTGPSRRWGRCGDSRVPSVLVGWGLGYWVNSLLYVISCSWDGGGWDNAPMIVRVVGYVITPAFGFASIFMFADPDVLGKRLEALVKPAIDNMKNRRRVEFWMLASVLRNILSFWIGCCISWGWLINYYWL